MPKYARILLESVINLSKMCDITSQQVAQQPSNTRFIRSSNNLLMSNGAHFIRISHRIIAHQFAHQFV